MRAQRRTSISSAQRDSAACVFYAHWETACLVVVMVVVVVVVVVTAGCRRPVCEHSHTQNTLTNQSTPTHANTRFYCYCERMRSAAAATAAILKPIKFYGANSGKTVVGHA